MADMLELGAKSEAMHTFVGLMVASSTVKLFFTLGGLSKFAASEAKAKSKKSRVILNFDSKEKLNKILLNLVRPGDVILIKGSRGMKMEEVVQHLKKNIR